MTDITGLLRWTALHGDLSDAQEAMTAAADEITRLRTEIDDLRSANQLLHGLIVNRDRNIERLLALLREALDPTDYVLTKSWCDRARRALEGK